MADEKNPRLHAGEEPDWSNGLSIAWALGFGLLLAGTATALGAFNVRWDVILAWLLISGGAFAMLEPGLPGLLWELVSRESAEPSPGREEAPVPSPTPPSPPVPAPPEPRGTALPAAGPPRPVEAEEGLRNKIEEARQQEEERRLARRLNKMRRRALEIGLTLALACLAYVASNALQAAPPSGIKTADTQRVIDELRKSLNECIEHACKAGAAANDSRTVSGGDESLGGGFSGGSLSADTELEKELLEYLKRAENQPNPSEAPIPWGRISVIVLLAAAAITAAIVLIVRKRPSTAAPIGAVGLASAAIKYADHLSRLDAASYQIVLYLFIAVVSALVVLGILELLKWGTPSDTETQPANRGGATEERRKVESPLNTLFSIAVLVWAILVICYRTETKSPKPASKTVSYKLLEPIYGFETYSTRIPGLGSGSDPVKALAREASLEIEAGDKLLLLGSADCTAIRKKNEMTNKQLAEGRADAVASALRNENFMDPGGITASSLYQHEACNQSANMRAVFPVLIQQAR
jgi:hypothetical protein